MVNYSVVTIPKSALEVIKNQIESDLQSATKQKNLKLIKKYQAELASVYGAPNVSDHFMTNLRYNFA